MVKKLYRSRTDRKIAGVCGGIAEYFEVDPTLIRIICLAAVCCCGGGLIAYLIAILVMQNNPGEYVK